MHMCEGGWGRTQDASRGKKKVLFTVREPHTLSVLLVLVIQHRRGAGELQRPDDGGRERETAAPVIYSQVPTKHISTI